MDQMDRDLPKCLPKTLLQKSVFLLNFGQVKPSVPASTPHAFVLLLSDHRPYFPYLFLHRVRYLGRVPSTQRHTNRARPLRKGQGADGVIAEQMFRSSTTALFIIGTLWGAPAVGVEIRSEHLPQKMLLLAAAPPMTIAELTGNQQSDIRRSSKKLTATKASIKASRSLISKSYKTPSSLPITMLLNQKALPIVDVLWRETTNAKSNESIAKTLPKNLKSQPVQKFSEVKTVKVVIPENGREPEAVITARGANQIKAPLNQDLGDLKGYLNIRVVDQELSFDPSSLVLPKVGSIAQIIFEGDLTQDVNFFVRSQEIIDFDKTHMELRGQKAGTTELYCVRGGKMYIVPIHVAMNNRDLPQNLSRNSPFPHARLKVPDDLVSLDGVLDHTNSKASYPRRDISRDTRSDAGTRPETGLSLEKSVRETIAFSERQGALEQQFVTKLKPLEYTTITLQILDDRSGVGRSDGPLFPIASAQVEIAGLGYRTQTDATGHVEIRDVPKGSRLQIRVRDQDGQIYDTVAEVDGRTGVQRIIAIRSFAFEMLQRVSGATQIADLGSFCATLQGDQVGLSGYTATLDVAGEGPYYFNKYGYLDLGQKSTGGDGRYCFLNVIPGPIAVTLRYDDGKNTSYSWVIPSEVYPAAHLELTTPLVTEVKLKVHLYSVGTVHEQLDASPQIANKIRSVDAIDMYAIGDDRPMEQIGEGVMATVDSVMPINGRVSYLAQGPEFEPMLYSTPAALAEKAVTPLFPRGFVEDMALYAQVVYQPELGVVLGEFGHTKDLEGSVNIRLVDSYGRDVGNAWYYADQPVTKAIFFNVNPGRYTVLVETKNGDWVASDTVTVYSETVSFARLGSLVSRAGM